MNTVNDCNNQNLNINKNKFIVLNHKSAGPVRILGEKEPTVSSDPGTPSLIMDKPIELQYKGLVTSGCQFCSIYFIAWIDDIFKMSESRNTLRRADSKEASIQEERPAVAPQQIVLLGLATEAIAGIAFASFIIGAIFMGIIWCIYVRTGNL